MNALSSQQWVIAFRWNYNGFLINKKISKQEATRDNLNGAIIRIGRDKSSCNLHLENSSVSSQHAEIYFHEEEQKFFIKSLQHKNTSQIDGQDLVYGQELPLKQNSTIVLGLHKIQVTDIQIYQLEPTNYLAIANPNPTPVNPNSNSIPVNLNVNLTSEDPRLDSNKSKYRTISRSLPKFLARLNLKSMLST